MSLREEQSKFARHIADLIIFAYSLGYELSFGDAYRDPRTKYGNPNSLHRKRLAVDFNLFDSGEYLQRTEDHTCLGKYWKSLDEKNAWGGDFEDGDGNHYSRSYGGMK